VCAERVSRLPPSIDRSLAGKSDLAGPGQNGPSAYLPTDITCLVRYLVQAQQGDSGGGLQRTTGAHVFQIFAASMACRVSPKGLAI
jgi:hypothetical protein